MGYYAKLHNSDGKWLDEGQNYALHKSRIENDAQV